MTHSSILLEVPHVFGKVWFLAIEQYIPQNRHKTAHCSWHGYAPLTIVPWQIPSHKQLGFPNIYRGGCQYSPIDQCHLHGGDWLQVWRGVVNCKMPRFRRVICYPAGGGGYHIIFVVLSRRCVCPRKWVCLSCSAPLVVIDLLPPIFITRVSEVTMFSPCVFVCMWLCLCLYHDVCPDDLTMKDWCHTNNILQVHCWGCLVVQVMFHALMTSSMTSPGHKVGEILKVIYLRQYLS